MSRGRFHFGPGRAAGCSRGWSDAALSVAEPVEAVTQTHAAPAGAEESGSPASYTPPMAELKFTDSQNLEKGLVMGSGFVLDFSDRTFPLFVKESTGLDIDDAKYRVTGLSHSKANRLRAFFKTEPNHVVGKLIADLVEHAPTSANPPLPNDLQRCQKIAERLQNGLANGPTVNALNWGAINAEGFERLVFNLVSRARGYANAMWPTNTNAPDRGRDISVERTVVDPLTGTRVFRVIVQCKHWRTKSIGMNEVMPLVGQMALWEPPKVDELIIATSGRFTTDAVAWVEKRNTERQTPIIAMWPDSHLESLLAERPDLVANFNLR